MRLKSKTGVNNRQSATIQSCLAPLVLDSRKARLTAKECDVLSILAQGKVTKEIADTLGISTATVASHRRSLCRKLCVHSTAELIHYAIRLQKVRESSQY